MKKKATGPLLVLLILLFNACSHRHAGESVHDYPITPVDFTQVQLQEGFWFDRVKTARDATIPFAFNKCEETGRIDNFIRAAGLEEGGFRGRYGFDDSDLYKIMEGAAYSLALEEDAEMEAYLDTLVLYISGAQEDDGYLYTAWTLNANEYNDFACCSYSEEGQFIGTPQSSHEFYNAGHMYEAAVAHYLATGKSEFLDVAIRNADLIYDVCITRGHDYVPGHQEIEIGLAKLYRVTGNRKYLELAKHLLDLRGRVDGGEYAQAHLPVTEQSEAVGHAVRANYMYSAMADVAALTGDSAYLASIDRIWNNVVGRKLSVTGGVGASRYGEAYGADYVLPNQPYNETCAAIANVYWNHRMFLLHGDASYMDVLERTLYNGLISGLSLDGTLFFYPNTLRHDGSSAFNQGINGRSPWFDCSCCPSNLSRFVPSVAGYAYAVKGNDFYVNLFMNSDATVALGQGDLEVSQRSDYPWNGKISIRFGNRKAVEAAVRLRIPGWARNEPVPSDLFRFADESQGEVSLKVNGEQVPVVLDHGYVVIQRKWGEGDLIELDLPMEPRTIRAHQRVEEKAGLRAVQYGPLVYCAEAVDNDVDVLEAGIGEDPAFTVHFREELLGGVNMLAGDTLNLVPYYAWANRGAGRMNVWFHGTD